jgi:hypothetical protein
MRLGVTAFCLGLLPAVAAPDILTVGPAGDYATVQAGVDRARALGGSNEIRIQQGTYAENVSALGTCCGGRLVISGGWDASFSLLTRDAATTVLDGGRRGRVFDLDSLTTRLVLDNLTLQSGELVPGAAFPRGGAGLRADLFGSGFLLLRGLVFRGNRITDAGSGAAVSLWVNDSARARVRACLFEGNLIDEGTASSVVEQGAGVSIAVTGAARVEVTRSVFRNNAVWMAGGGVGPNGVGLALNLFGADGATASVEDNRFESNLILGAAFAGGTSGASIIADGGTSSDPNVEFRRNVVTRNGGTGGYQLTLVVRDGASLVATDSVVSQGDAGVQVAGFDPSYLGLNNFTVVDHSGDGVRANSTYAKVSVFNTIAFRNGVDLAIDGDAFGGSNLTGVNPRFVNLAGGNYRLRSTSPAIDAGADVPPGGLGPLDLDRGPRIEGLGVDIGAYEFR